MVPYGRRDPQRIGQVPSWKIILLGRASPHITTDRWTLELYEASRAATGNTMTPNLRLSGPVSAEARGSLMSNVEAVGKPRWRRSR